MDGISGQDELERIRDGNPIEDVIQGYVELTRRGNVFKGLCPFHGDNNPSMDVNPDRRTFRCWSCDEHGDVFSFIQKIEQCEFVEAKQILADRAGIEIQQWRRDPIQEQEEDQDLQLLERTTNWFQKQLQAPGGAVAREYLASRGFSEDSIRKFRIGFAPPGWSQLFDELKRFEQESPGVLARAENLGLLNRKTKAEGDRVYDVYRDRVIFPIREARRGKVVGFGGRHLGSDPQATGEPPAKYYNSRESRVFSKKHLLYGYREGRKDISRSRRVILCEGYTDVIMAHQNGYPMAVATLGTALTQENVSFLARKVDSVDLLFDGDDAGQRAALRSSELFLGTEVGVRVVILDAEQDPCDLLVSEQGPQQFEQLLESGVDPIEFVVQQILLEYPGESTAVSQRRISEISRRVLDRFDGATLEVAARVVARLTGYSEPSILHDHQRLSATHSVPRSARNDQQGEGPLDEVPAADLLTEDLTSTEDAILVQMVRYPSQVEVLLKICPPERWSHPIRRELALRIRQFGEIPDPVHIQDVREKSYFLRLVERVERENSGLSTADRFRGEFDLSLELLVRFLEQKRQKIPYLAINLEDIVSINEEIQKITEEPDSFKNSSLLLQIINKFVGRGEIAPSNPELA
ncbi:MAG: DNA primase [Planctomycetota bacterium]